MDGEAELVHESYGRCCLSPGFFEDFYRAFIDASPKVSEKFAGVDMDRQRDVLRGGINYLIMFYKGSELGRHKIESLAKSHARDQMDIAPGLYAIWERTLLDTIDTHDGPVSEELRGAWQTVLSLGIDEIKRGYFGEDP